MQTKDGCTAAILFDCPKGEPGKPAHTCNPPAPLPYKCPDNIKDLLAAGPVTIETQGSICVTHVDTPTCPPNTMCNPPRPRTVACPK